MHGCVLGAACDNGTCVTQSSGSPCLGHEDCLARMYCSTDGVCTEQKQYGASCASSEQCLSGACYQDHICHAGLEVGPHLCSGQPLKPPGTGGG